MHMMDPMERYAPLKVAHLEQSIPGIPLTGCFGIWSEVVLLTEDGPGDDHHDHHGQQEITATLLATFSSSYNPKEKLIGTVVRGALHPF